MKKKLAAIAFAGMMAVGLTAGNVQAAEPSGEVYVFIAASLANAMEDIQKDFNQKYPDVEIFYNADSSGTLQTQIEEGLEADVFMSAAAKQMTALDEEGMIDLTPSPACWRTRLCSLFQQAAARA